MNVKVQIFNESKNTLPQYATDFSAGVDLMMWKDGLKEFDKIIIPPHRHILIGTGLHVAIPEGYELQIRPRSGLAAKKAITVLNTPGTIDSDYRGEIKVILFNHSDETIAFSNGEKIAQAVLNEVPKIEWETIDNLETLPKSVRGEGGFGSTDKTPEIIAAEKMNAQINEANNAEAKPI
jgi:dUTP pyrophosphatase